MTIPQKRAWAGLAISLIVITVIFGFLVPGGVDSWFADSTYRTTVYAVLAFGSLFYGIAVLLTRPGSGQVLIDERDIIIERRAMKTQLLAVNGSLMCWMIILTEIYWDKGSIPLGWPYLIFLSTMLITLISGAIGTLIGYIGVGHDE